MKKWIFLAIILFLPFALGLRIDFEVLAGKVNKKPDPNAAALAKMGLSPSDVGLKEKPWWTFKPEDNLFTHFQKWDPVGGMSKDSQRATQELKKGLGPSPAEIAEQQARSAAAQARRNQERMAQEMEKQY